MTAQVKATMTYEEFLEFVPHECMHEAIYDDSEGRTIVVIRMLDLYALVNGVVKRAKEK